MLVRGGSYNAWDSNINEEGKKQANTLVETIKTILPDSYGRTVVCYPFPRMDFFTHEGQTARIIGEGLERAVNLVHEFSIKPTERFIPGHYLEKMARVYEGWGVRAPVLAVLSPNVLLEFTRYAGKIYKIDGAVACNQPDLGEGYLLNPPNRDFVGLPSGQSIQQQRQLF